MLKTGEQDLDAGDNYQKNCGSVITDPKIEISVEKCERLVLSPPPVPLNPVDYDILRIVKKRSKCSANYAFTRSSTPQNVRHSSIGFPRLESDPDFDGILRVKSTSVGVLTQTTSDISKVYKTTSILHDFNSDDSSSVNLQRTQLIQKKSKLFSKRWIGLLCCAARHKDAHDDQLTATTMFIPKIRSDGLLSAERDPTVTFQTTMKESKSALNTLKNNNGPIPKKNFCFIISSPFHHRLTKSTISSEEVFAPSVSDSSSDNLASFDPELQISGKDLSKSIAKSEHIASLSSDEHNLMPTAHQKYCSPFNSDSLPRGERSEYGYIVSEDHEGVYRQNDSNGGIRYNNPDDVGDGSSEFDALIADTNLLDEQSDDCIGKKCLVLDLDETLVHSSFKDVANPDFSVMVEIENMKHEVCVCKRPHLDTFMNAIGPLFECVVFTASLRKYADPVCDRIDPSGYFRHRLFRDDCVCFRNNYIKNLALLGRSMEQICIIDNSPVSFYLQRENALQIVSWFDDPNDIALLELIPYLRKLAAAETVVEFLRTCPPPENAVIAFVDALPGEGDSFPTLGVHESAQAETGMYTYPNHIITVAPRSNHPVGT